MKRIITGAIVLLGITTLTGCGIQEVILQEKDFHISQEKINQGLQREQELFDTSITTQRLIEQEKWGGKDNNGSLYAIETYVVYLPTMRLNDTVLPMGNRTEQADYEVITEQADYEVITEQADYKAATKELEKPDGYREEVARLEEIYGEGIQTFIENQIKENGEGARFSSARFGDCIVNVVSKPHLNGMVEKDCTVILLRDKLKQNAQDALYKDLMARLDQNQHFVTKFTGNKDYEMIEISNAVYCDRRSFYSFVEKGIRVECPVAVSYKIYTDTTSVEKVRVSFKKAKEQAVESKDVQPLYPLLTNLGYGEQDIQRTVEALMKRLNANELGRKKGKLGDDTYLYNARANTGSGFTSIETEIVFSR